MSKNPLDLNRHGLSLHPSIADAINQIDAGFFSGDEFLDSENRECISAYIARWSRHIEEIETDLEDGAPEELSGVLSDPHLGETD